MGVFALKFKLKDGRIVEIRSLGAKMPVRTILDYINELIREDAYLLEDMEFTYNQEKEWKKTALKNIRKGNHLHLCAFSGKKMVGGATATRDRGRARGNVLLGIAIAKGFRGAGLGKFLLREMIERAKKKFKPKNIYLSVFAPNRAAMGLYKKLGFRQIGRFPEWVRYKKKHVDVFWMLLK